MPASHVYECRATNTAHPPAGLLLSAAAAAAAPPAGTPAAAAPTAAGVVAPGMPGAENCPAAPGICIAPVTAGSEPFFCLLGAVPGSFFCRLGLLGSAGSLGLRLPLALPSAGLSRGAGSAGGCWQQEGRPGGRPGTALHEAASAEEVRTGAACEAADDGIVCPAVACMAVAAGGAQNLAGQKVLLQCWLCARTCRVILLDLGLCVEGEDVCLLLLLLLLLLHGL
jgi:hypothetical protein